MRCCSCRPELTCVGLASQLIIDSLARLGVLVVGGMKYTSSSGSFYFILFLWFRLAAYSVPSFIVLSFKACSGLIGRLLDRSIEWSLDRSLDRRF